MDKTLISKLFFWKLLGYRLSANTLKKKKKLIDIGGLPRKCAYQTFIIQILDVMTLELDIKVQFVNF
jgi:hypothetical protein